MIADQPNLAVPLAWIAALLIALSLIAAGLSTLRGPEGDLNPVIDNLNNRIRGWWIMSGLMALFSLGGQGGVVILFAICSMGALREFLTLTTRSRADYWAFVASFFVVLPIHYFSIWMDWHGFYSFFIPVYAFLLLPMLSVIGNRPDRFLARVAETQWALMICVFSLSHWPMLLFLDIPGFEGRGVLLMVFLVLVVQGGDLAQHFWSACLGRRPVAPAISPGRTWEGIVGGILTAAGIGAALAWLGPFNVAQAAVLGGAAAAAGGFGRLVMFAIKRDRGVEDWGHMNDGQGGFLDRLDSVIFAAPIFFHLTRILFQTGAAG